MSLIVDALKAAQDERNDRAGRADAAARQRFASSTLRSSATLSVAGRGTALGSAPRSFWVSLGVFVVALAAGGVVVATVPEPGQAALVSDLAGPSSADQFPKTPQTVERTERSERSNASGKTGELGGGPTEWRIRSTAPAPNDPAPNDNDNGLYVSAPLRTDGDRFSAIEAKNGEAVEAPESQPFQGPAAPPPLARAPAGRLEVTLQNAEGPRSSLFEEAISAQRRGDHSAAVELYRRVIETQPANAEIFNNYGSALQSTGDLANARTAFERALALQPRYAATWSNLGVLLGQIGEDDSSLAALTEATRLDPRNAGARVNLALVYQRRGIPAEARKLLEEVLTAEPRQAEANYALARLLDSNQEYPAALRHYRLFLAHGSNRFPQYEAAVRVRIQQMEASGVH